MPGPRHRQPATLAGVFQELRADFRAGKDTRFVSRLTGVSSMGSGADYHYRSESQWLHMLERARHYQRNDQVVGQGIRRVVANIVQDGFRLDPQTGDKQLDASLKAAWNAWSCDPDLCHSEGELCFSEIEQVALSSVITDGDVFVLPLAAGSLQMVEAHRCRTPRNTSKNVVHGVLLDDMARRDEYWFTKEDLDPRKALNKVSEVKSYPARDAEGRRQVLHLYMPYRFSQRRGVTFLAPISDTVGMHDDVQFATLVKSQMAALIAILHERGPQWEPLGQQQKGERTQETHGGFTRTIEGVGAGLEIFADPDEKLSAFAPSIPSPEFFPHTMLLLTFIAINLDIPVHVLLLDPSRTNFSGWRGAIDQARLRFRQIQDWLVKKFHTPVYFWWVRQHAARLAARGDSRLAEIIARAGTDGAALNPFAHRWNPPQFPYIEPLTDARADELQQAQCLNSRRRIQAARGRDWDELSDEIVADNGSFIEKAIVRTMEINRKYPDAGVDWREVITVPASNYVAANLQLDTDHQQQMAEQEKPAGNGGGANGYGGRLGRALNGSGVHG